MLRKDAGSGVTQSGVLRCPTVLTASGTVDTAQLLDASLISSSLTGDRGFSASWVPMKSHGQGACRGPHIITHEHWTQGSVTFSLVPVNYFSVSTHENLFIAMYFNIADSHSTDGPGLNPYCLAFRHLVLPSVGGGATASLTQMGPCKSQVTEHILQVF